MEHKYIVQKIWGKKKLSFFHQYVMYITGEAVMQEGKFGRDRYYFVIYLSGDSANAVPH